MCPAAHRPSTERANLPIVAVIRSSPTSPSSPTCGPGWFRGARGVEEEGGAREEDDDGVGQQHGSKGPSSHQVFAAARTRRRGGAAGTTPNSNDPSMVPYSVRSGVCSTATRR